MVSFNSLKMAAKSVQMACKGFKKVPLRDTRGVLNETNNFKWVREKGDIVDIVLPKTGTKVQKYSRISETYVTEKSVTLTNGTEFRKVYGPGNKVMEKTPFSPFFKEFGTSVFVE